VHVYSTETVDPMVRGREIGARWRQEIAATVSDYDWLFDAAGLDRSVVRRIADDCLTGLRAWAPELATELAGIAQGSGLPEWRVAALNARTEILVRGAIAGLKECSVAALLPAQGPPRALQTWDWIPRAQDFSVRRYRTETGLRVVAFAEHGVLAKLGVNSAGIGVLFTLLCHTSDGSKPGVPVHAVARRMLDRANSVQQACEIALSAPLAASAAITVLHWDGRRATGRTLEIAPSGSAVLPPRDGYLLHTNHFLDPELALGDRLVPIGDDTVPRMQVLADRAGVLDDGTPTDWARGLVVHWEDGAPVCAHPRADAAVTNRWETKMTFSLDLSAPALLMHEGGPCTVTAAGWTTVAG
jgi:isopenicillin-N N-acyltransferase-like protein